MNKRVMDREPIKFISAISLNIVPIKRETIKFLSAISLDIVPLSIKSEPKFLSAITLSKALPYAYHPL